MFAVATLAVLVASEAYQLVELGFGAEGDHGSVLEAA